MSFCALLQTITVPYTQIKRNVGVKEAAQPVTEMQQLHRAFCLAFSLPGHFLDLYAHFLPPAFASVTVRKVETKLDGQGDAAEQSLLFLSGSF